MMRGILNIAAGLALIAYGLIMAVLLHLNVEATGLREVSEIFHVVIFGMFGRDAIEAGWTEMSEARKCARTP